MDGADQTGGEGTKLSPFLLARPPQGTYIPRPPTLPHSRKPSCHDSLSSSTITRSSTGTSSWSIKACFSTWRLSAPPEEGTILDAEQSFDHRLFYLDHEGPVSGGRGSVTCWDGGTFDWETHEPNRVVVSLAGARLRGMFRLECAAGGAWRGRFTGNAEKES